MGIIRHRICFRSSHRFPWSGAFGDETFCERPLSSRALFKLHSGGSVAGELNPGFRIATHRDPNAASQSARSHEALLMGGIFTEECIFGVG
jgi:hypothetical protein